MSETVLGRLDTILRAAIKEPQHWEPVLRDSGLMDERYADKQFCKDIVEHIPVSVVDKKVMDAVQDEPQMSKIVLPEKFSATIEKVRAIEVLRQAWWLRWGLMNEHLYNPFEHAERPLNDQWLVGREKPETEIYSFRREPLRQTEIDSITATADWFADHTGIPQRITLVRRLIISKHRGFWYRDFGKGMGTLSRPVAGEHDGWRSLVTIHEDYMHTSTSMERYEPILQKGVGLFDIYLTHEYAHALADLHPSAMSHFRNITGWRRNEPPRKYRKKMPEIEGIVFNDSKPPTEYAWTNAAEDFAESVVMYRFDPSMLDVRRRDALSMILGKRTEAAAHQAIQVSKPMYPQIVPPERILVRHQGWGERMQDLIRAKYENHVQRMMRVSDVMLRGVLAVDEERDRSERGPSA